MSSPRRAVLKAENRILPGFEATNESRKWTEPFYFIQAADTQLGLIDHYGDGSVGSKYPNITWEKEIELCNKSVDIINALRPKPKFFIICGDLVDAMPAAWPKIREKQESDFLKIYSRLDPEIPLVCVCGNHDVGNTPTKETVATYRSSFGDDYFSFWVGGVHFLVLNSQFYEDSSQVPELAQAQESWLDEQLEQSKKVGSTHLVLFQHIPWFLETANEDKTYFNVEPELRQKMLKKFLNAGVKKIFAGHYHRNAGGWYEELEMIVTTAIGCQIGPDTHGMRVVKVTEESISHDFHALANFPDKVELPEN